MILPLLSKAAKLLRDCTCESACYRCLKHYRNQHLHGSLDRIAALELLEWGIGGILARPIPLERQKKALFSLEHVLEESGCQLEDRGNVITACADSDRKNIIVYPAMWIKPGKENTIFVNEMELRYAKPYAVEKILSCFGRRNR